MRNKNKIKIRIGKKDIKNLYARRNFIEFTKQVKDDIEITEFHETYFKILDEFARGNIRKLIISVPPQHGKSLAASILLPAYMLGVDPNKRIAIGSYSFALAKTFGMSLRRIMCNGKYNKIFPEVFFKGENNKNYADEEKTDRGAVRSAQQLDMVGWDGGIRMVGRQGALTGCRVDVMIIDDLYKDAAEANSPIIRESAWEWYTSVVKTRLHNKSQEIIVFTRWHEEDLIGKISRSENVIEINELEDINKISKLDWVKINFEAIKKSPKSKLDNRNTGEPLWENRHSIELLEAKRKLDPVAFEALYQGNPKAKEGLLYAEFKTYDVGQFDQKCVRTMAYVDTADTGKDRLCAVVYAMDMKGQIYIRDVLLSDKPMEITEKIVAEMMDKWKVKTLYVESNNGGRGYARAIQRLMVGNNNCQIISFFQNLSKQARILSNASTVNNSIWMPQGWKNEWKEFADEITNFKRNFDANKHDDAVDTITGIVEKEFERCDKIKKIKTLGFRI